MNFRPHLRHSVFVDTVDLRQIIAQHPPATWDMYQEYAELFYNSKEDAMQAEWLRNDIAYQKWLARETGQ